MQSEKLNAECKTQNAKAYNSTLLRLDRADRPDSYRVPDYQITDHLILNGTESVTCADMNGHEHLIVQHLSQFISDHKREFVEKVLNMRTRKITVVLEDIFQSQNASAVIRTCECLGIQDVHIVENTTKYSINPRVLKGSNKWIDIKHHASKNENNTIALFTKLKEQGYEIAVTDPGSEGVAIEDLDIDNKIALVFGNELRGISAEALALCDERVRIPMFGFTESFNISVSAAICLNTLVTKQHANGSFVGLSDSEKQFLKLKWYRKIVRKSDLIEREFLRTIE